MDALRALIRRYRFPVIVLILLWLGFTIADEWEARHAAHPSQRPAAPRHSQR